MVSPSITPPSGLKSCDGLTLPCPPSVHRTSQTSPSHVPACRLPSLCVQNLSRPDSLTKYRAALTSPSENRPRSVLAFLTRNYPCGSSQHFSRAAVPRRGPRRPLVSAGSEVGGLSAAAGSWLPPGDPGPCLGTFVAVLTGELLVWSRWRTETVLSTLQGPECCHPSHEKQKCLQTLPHIPWGRITPIENHHGGVCVCARVHARMVSCKNICDGRKGYHGGGRLCCPSKMALSPSGEWL
jgi:hypothetical protein